MHIMYTVWHDRSISLTERGEEWNGICHPRGDRQVETNSIMAGIDMGLAKWVMDVCVSVWVFVCVCA